MRFSLRLLRDYLEADATTQQLIDAIQDAGLEVEEVIDLGLISGKVVVGEILAISPIEGADKIRLTSINTGVAEPLRIVCGAQNIEVGQRVPVALFGMTFPDGFVLKPKRIKGIDGQGMLCSAKELGVADDADGIWILPGDAPIGQPWDALIEVKITPNRPDALSYIGLARDAAAKLGGRLRAPEVRISESTTRVESRARVTVHAKAECPRYTARVVEGVSVAPSPRWLQVALESSGIRPISNMVDVTNWVLLEFGHPLHGFDNDRLAGGGIVVRLAEAGERLTTLDGKEAELHPGDLLICDEKQPVALAGIMGGGNSEIGDETRTILIESAYFRPATIRRTARRLDKKTEASYRFERGTDVRRLAVALNRCAELMASLGGGSVLKGYLDVVGDLVEPRPITLRLARASAALGIPVSGREAADIFRRLEFEVLRSDAEQVTVSIPSHRVDVSIEEDLIEELARIIGFDRIPCELPLLRATAKSATQLRQATDALRDAFLDAGLNEALNFSFVSEGANALVGGADDLQVRLRNPLTKDQAVLRRSLVPSLLANLVHNLNNSVPEVRLFEIARTFAWRAPEGAELLRTSNDLTTVADEVPVAAAIIAGGGKPNWRDAARTADFFDMKGIVEFVLARAGVTRVVVEPARDIPWLHPGRAATILVKGEPVGCFGELHPAVARELEIKPRTCILELRIVGALLDAAVQPRYTEIPRFPAAVRDIAVVVDRNVPSIELERTIRKAGKDLLASVTVFDRFEGAQVGEGRKSLAYSLTFRAPDRTLQEAEVTTLVDAAVVALKERHGAVLR